jgi:6-phosphofructokinase
MPRKESNKISCNAIQKNIKGLTETLMKPIRSNTDKDKINETGFFLDNNK